jgi:heat shock protein HtpX
MPELWASGTKGSYARWVGIGGDPSVSDMGTMAVTTATAIDPAKENALQSRNLVDTVLLIGGMTLLLAVAGYQFLGLLGSLLAVLAVGGLAFAAPSVPPAAVLALYRARPMDPAHGDDVYLILDELVARAGLRRAPSLHVIPSLNLNAFSVGGPNAAAIALSEGLLRKLDLRQIAGVLAHELSHIRNNDLRLMAIADAIGRTMQMLSWAGLGLLVYYVPQYFVSDARVPWLGIALLYLGPAIATLLQLALSRAREFDADLDAAALTGDPAGLATALRLIDRQQGHFWEDLVFPSARRVPLPSMLRTHPDTERRIAQLRELVPADRPAPIGTRIESPRVSLVGVGPSAMRPRFRIPGVWF